MEGRAFAVLERVSGLETLEDFQQLIAAEQWLLQEEVLAELDQLRVDPLLGRGFGLACDLLTGAAKDKLASAWGEYRTAIKESEAIGMEVVKGIEEVSAALEATEAEKAVERATNLLASALQAGLPVFAVALHELRGKAYLILPTGDRAENIEAAIEDLRFAAEFGTSDRQHGDVLMHAAIAFRERVKFDRRRNLEQSVELFRQARTLLVNAGDEASDDLALLEINLAGTLLDVEGKQTVDRLREAVALCQSASTQYSPASNPERWAYARFNQGLAIQDLARLGKADPEEARHCFESILIHADSMPEWIVGQCHCAIGRLLKSITEQSVEEVLSALEDPDEVERQHRERLSLLEEARVHFEKGIPLTADDWFPKRRGKALDEMAEVLTRLERIDEAIVVGREALQILRPTTAPHECRAVGWRLGSQLASRGDWKGASQAFGDALEAAELAFHARIDRADRDEQSRQAGELARWSAMAFARIGRFRDAVLALEGGRTRELRRRLRLGEAEDSALEDLPADLRNEFLSAASLLSRSSLDFDGTDPGRNFQEIVQRIRMLAGQENFAAGPRWEDLAGAVSSGRPMVYVNPTPWGTSLVRLETADGELRVDALLLEEPTSIAVHNQLAFGQDRLTESLLTQEPASFFAAVIAGDGKKLQRALERSLPWIGSSISKPATQWLVDTDASSVTLIPCGPIATVPLGAAPWHSGGREQCMLDALSVSYAPSGFLAARAASHADEGFLPPRLMALVDTSLGMAEAEIEEISGHFEGRLQIGTDEKASAEFFREHVVGATHVHLACHGQGELLGSGVAGIDLPSGQLAARDLTTIEDLTARLTVISACESAVPRISDLAGEAFSTSTAMLAAGSACVIASLWQVSDRATALLMTRVYEELFGGGVSPPEALRRGQLWLRDLTDEGLGSFLDSHPPLRAALREDEASFRRTTARAAQVPGRPYSHPDFWAPFIAVGA